MFESHNTFNTYDRLRANASTFRSADPIMKSINNSHPAAFNSSPNDMDYHRTGMSMPPSSVSSNGIFPRSASEAQFDTASKFRQLPCRTFISVGTCPYRERCVYLHDPRCICKEAKTKTRRKNKEDVVLDSLFWPVMPYPMVAGKLDMNRQPHVIQSYSVPIPQYDQFHQHDSAVYSLWMHFVDFCMANNESSMHMYNTSNTTTVADSAACYCAPNDPMNSYTNQSRLQIFQFFASCHGCSVSSKEVLHASSVDMPINARHVHIPRATHPVTTSGTNTAPTRTTPGIFKTPLLQDQHNHHFYNQQAGGAHTRVSELYDQHHQLQQQRHHGGGSTHAQASHNAPGGNYPSVPLHSHYAQEQQQQQQSALGRFSPQPSATAFATQYAHSSSASPITVDMERIPQHAEDRTLLTSVSTAGCTSSSINMPAPTSMSVLNSIPQSNNTQQQQEPVKFKQDFLFDTSDPWTTAAADNCSYSGGVTDDERDSGSSFNSDSFQDDMNAIWKRPNSSTTSSNNNARNCNEKGTNSFSVFNTAITAAAGVGAALGYAL